MNMIRHSSDAFRLSIESFDDAAEIRMKFLSPFFSDDGLAVFGRKDQMKMKAGVGGGHNQQGEDGTPAGVLESGVILFRWCRCYADSTTG